VYCITLIVHYQSHHRFFQTRDRFFQTRDRKGAVGPTCTKPFPISRNAKRKMFRPATRSAPNEEA